MEIDDLLPNGFVHCWSLVDGYPRCITDAIDTNAPGALVALQQNAAIRTLIGAVEPYEAALALVARGEPDNGQPKTIADPTWVDPGDGAVAPLVANPEWTLLPRTVTTTDDQGQPQTAPEPRWQAFDAAGATTAGASATTLAHALWRTAQPSDSDPALAAWDAARAAVQAALATLAAQPLADDPRVGRFSAQAVKDECQRRVYAVASPNCQMNMTAWIAGGNGDADRPAFNNALAWVQAMRGVCLALIAAADPTYASASHWPACPPDVAALASRF